jgi:general secretion pathway protein B
MSYILDALKKIEHEKNSKTRPDGRINISGDLFRERTPSTSRAGIWKIAVLLFVASLVTFVGTWFVLRGDGNKNSRENRPRPPLSSAPVKPPVVTAVIPAPIPPPQSTSLAVPPVSSPAVVPVVPKKSEVVADEDSSERSRRRPKKQVKNQHSPPKLPSQVVQAPADIKLSGIAWQDERSVRRAVINGFLLKEGSVVSGAKITDIQTDRVVFITSAGQFEIKLDSVVPAEVKR